MFFSVIVPVYKVESYLSIAVNSVLGQNFEDYELILVDDGSPDKCPMICDSYAEKNEKVKVIHKKNGGVSDARNAGLEKAVGRYIIFLDSDDVLEDGIMQKLYYLIEKDNPDLIIGTYRCFNEDKVFDKVELIKDNLKTEFKTIYELIEYTSVHTGMIPWKPYQSVYRKDYLEKNNLVFNIYTSAAEDCEFFMKLVATHPEFSVLNESFVSYRIGRKGSIITNPSFSAIKGQLIVFSNCFWELEEKYSEKHKLTKYFAMRYANIIILIANLKEQAEIQECVNIIKKNKKILRLTPFKLKYIVPRLVWSFLGYYKGSILLKKVQFYIKKKV